MSNANVINHVYLFYFMFIVIIYLFYRSDLERYKDDYAEMGEKLKTVKAEFASALEKVISDHSIMHSKLNEARERLSVLSDQLNELVNFVEYIN